MPRRGRGKGSESTDPTVFVVDDDPAIRRSLAWLLESVGLRVETFLSAEAFSASYDPARPGCLVLDVRLPGMSGLELQEQMAEQGASLPVIFVTGYGEVRTAVDAVKSGAVDYMEKPYSEQQLLERVHQAIERDREAREARKRDDDFRRRLASLSRRERQVMDLLVAGKTNRATAAALGISERTVEVHRQRVMIKMGVSSLAELVQASVRTPEYPAK